eukprot:scaffold88301_cov45-Attheya_sp.AAC.1
MDRSGMHKKIHDWTLFVDVVLGNPDLIQRVTFDLKDSTFEPSKFKCEYPIPVTRTPNGNNSNMPKVYRFYTRQQSYHSDAKGPHAHITIRGSDGSVFSIRHWLKLTRGGSLSEKPLPFRCTHGGLKKPLKPIQMHQSNFGIELELMSAESHCPQTVATAICDHSKIQVDVMLDELYSAARATSKNWKLVSDSSLQCRRDDPNCTKFELVSPILKGGKGLEKCNKIMEGLKQISSVDVNKSMGFHVHIDVSSLSVSQLIKVCQNFVKYEPIVDTLMPPSRRTDNTYCKSNRDEMVRSDGRTKLTSNKDRHTRIGACKTVKELCEVMNPGNIRYFKLNLQNLRTGRQPTIEFRQHSSTKKYEKVQLWVRFCMAFVHNSASFEAPNFLGGRWTSNFDKQSEMLFDYLIKDRCLRKFYRERRNALNKENESDHACCSGCAGGGHCEASRRPTKRIRSHLAL